ncbi:unnamed protein product [Thlaspi arvense]|uniref:DUF7953 domain-containing protein n=1 Tax=Thlaspi arvense TaxID=13288 RepID=A0AAU9T150_THLAR|nr:unnamed protein product [Thlaspi arvense]
MDDIHYSHDWFKLKHTVYFQCKGENKTVLPDVTKSGILYTFRGQESWQARPNSLFTSPMTEISGEKCKRCGIYEQGSLISDKEFDEWELCPSDFSASQIYMHSKDKEINATFVCHGCAKLESVSAEAKTGSSSKEEGDNGATVAIAVVAGVLCATLVVVGGVFMFKHSKRMKLQRDQARFMKLFEESDEPEDELGLEPVI